MGGAGRLHYHTSLAAKWAAFSPTGVHAGLGEEAGDLAGGPVRPDGPRPAGPLAGSGVRGVHLACAGYQSHARAREKPEHPRGRTVPAEVARDDEDAAWPGFPAQTRGG